MILRSLLYIWNCLQNW